MGDIVALIVTYRRRQDLLTTLASVRAQTHPVEHILVVDNSPQGECGQYADLLAGVEVLFTGANLGYSGGLNVGLEHLLRTRSDGLVWILDDDSPVASDSLAKALATLETLGPEASLSNRGFVFRWTGIEVVGGGPQPRRVEAALVDGGLFPLRVVRRAGPPRADFFMLFEDGDFTLRLSRAGSKIFISNDVRSRPLHRGSSGPDSAWRGYYQTRNSIRSAIDLAHPRLLSGSLVRLGKQMTWLALRGDETRSARMRLRWSGLRDGILDRMGITVDPDTARAVGEITGDHRSTSRGRRPGDADQ